MKSENKNFLMNVVYQGLTLIFPLITVPWVSRALGVDNVGIYSYTYSIANMFMLVGMLGVSNYGNRSVARVRDDSQALSREFSAIYALQLAVNLVSIFAYTGYLAFFAQEYMRIAQVQLIYVISICFDVSWLYFGLEKFKLTITRNLIIKVLSLALIMLLVRQPGDLWVYSVIMASSTLVSQLYLFVNLRKYVEPVRPQLQDVINRIKDVVILFVPVAAYSIYRVLDKAMIGSLSSVTELGYFENAEKLINIPVAVITALGTVMLPRMSHVLADSSADYRGAIRDSMKLALMLACSMATGLIVIADDACPVVFGTGYEGCAPVIRLLAVSVICSAWANVIRTQYLIPRLRDSVYVGSTVGAAIVNLVLNLVLIPRFGSLGACVGTIAAELSIAAYQSVATKDELDVEFYLKILLVNSAKSILMAAGALIAASFVNGSLARLIIEILTFTSIFIALNARYIIVDFLGINK